MTTKSNQTVAIRFDAPLSPDGFESVTATAVGHGRFRIDQIPVFVDDLARTDVVSVEYDGEDFTSSAQKVVERGGHSTMLVLLENDFLKSLFRDKSLMASFTKEVRSFDCDVHGFSKYMAIDVGAVADLGGLLRFLEDRKSDGKVCWYKFRYIYSPPRHQLH